MSSLVIPAKLVSDPDRGTGIQNLLSPFYKGGREDFTKYLLVILRSVSDEGSSTDSQATLQSPFLQSKII